MGKHSAPHFPGSILAADEQQGEKVLSCPSTSCRSQHLSTVTPAPLGWSAGGQEVLGGQGPAFPGHRGWQCFRAGGQIDFSSAVSTLMHSSVQSSITPQTSLARPQEKEALGCAGRAGAPALQAPAGREVEKHQRELEKAAPGTHRAIKYLFKHCSTSFICCLMFSHLVVG